ncbi:helix-turn-helix transcriptional regulator [Chloroflexia bacterium SDU3-3]|nr:helix-turn-helix transcriptional regulator [Chloroflexia bacterium SDU3-3]
MNYTFAELLHVFFALHTNKAIHTYSELSSSIGVSRRTINAWFAGEYPPRSKELVLRIAEELLLTPQQADLLLYSVKPSWVAYGTPPEVLEHIQLFRYSEDADATPTINSEDIETPDLSEIMHLWSICFDEPFTSNHQSWGTGVKDDGVCAVHRSIAGGRYTLELQNRAHETAFMAGDSSCFAPKTFCLTAQVRMLSGGNDDEGAALVFEEISDNCFALFRMRPYTQQASVVQTFEGRNHHHIYINRISAPSIKKDDTNTLAIICIDESFWFYINGAPVQKARTHIPRLSRSRLDVAVIAGAFRSVSAAWSNFCVRVPRPPSVDIDP